MKDKILISAYEQILEDTKLIRLATITYIFHSIIFVVYILYQTYFIFSQISWNTWLLQLILKYIQSLLNHENLLIISIILLSILLIGYFLLPPIAEASIIYYLNDKEKKWSKSLWKWVLKFFPMFELHGFLSLFSFLAFFIAISRFYVLNILSHPLVITITIIWLILIIVISIITPYTKYIIVLENKWLKEAIKSSLSLTLENFPTTIKYVFINYILYIRFLINILIIVWIPLITIVLIVKFNLNNSEIWKYILIIIILTTTFLTAYINGIIEAFFLTYWNKVYKKITNKTTS